MKKFFALMLALVMALSMVACGSTGGSSTDASAKSEGTMTYAEYVAADLDSEVTIEAFVQAKQSWWDNMTTLYLQDADGAYLIYKLACSQEEYDKMTVGTKLKVTGFKIEWAGEVEVDGENATFEILEGNYTAERLDVTDLLGSDELIDHQNKLVSFKGMTVEPSVDPNGNEVAFLYNWDGSGSENSDSDLYFNVSVNGETYTFVVEYYDCDANGIYGPDTDVYKAVQNLQIGDTVDLEGILYWYEGPNPHITAVK